jgi:hypothetical protein
MKDKGREGLINIGMNRCGREGERNVDSVVLEREGRRRGLCSNCFCIFQLCRNTRTCTGNFFT